MVIINLRATEPAAERTFTTYANYLAHLRLYLLDAYNDADLCDGLVTATRGGRKFKAIQRRRLSPVEQEQLSRAHRLSWATEAQLRLRSSHDLELMPDLLHGAASEAYYTVFHASRALFGAGNFSGGDNHASALNQLGTLVRERKLFPPPWSAYADGGFKSQDFRLGGLPSGVVTSPLSPLAAPSLETGWDSVRLLLSTTRDRRLEELRDEWYRREGKKRLLSAQAAVIARDTPPTTLFHFLWRLRKRSDYRDADVFLSGIWTPQQALDYHRALATLVAATVTVLDALSIAYAGPSVYQETAQRFTRPSYEMVPHRMKALLKARS